MKVRVLVVDDDHLVADTLCSIFRANGFASEARYTAAAGFEYAQSYRPALMVCDVIMPGESGVQLAGRVREILPDTQLLLLTAYPTGTAQLRRHIAEFTARQGAPGEDSFGGASLQTWPRLLSKPCRPDDLLRETRALLQMA